MTESRQIFWVVRNLAWLRDERWNEPHQEIDINVWIFSNQNEAQQFAQDVRDGINLDVDAGDSRVVVSACTFGDDVIATK